MTDLQTKLEALDKAAGPSHAIGVHVGMSDMPEGMRDFLTSLVDAYRANQLVAAPTGDVQVIDIEKGFWEQINAAANESPWIPREHYFMNDWVADVCRYLRTGNGDVSAPTGDPDGIECLDDTIKLQDTRIADLRGENARLTLEFADLQFAYKHLCRYMFDKTPERREMVIGRYLDKVAARAALGGRSDG